MNVMIDTLIYFKIKIQNNIFLKNNDNINYIISFISFIKHSIFSWKTKITKWKWTNGNWDIEKRIAGEDNCKNARRK